MALSPPKSCSVDEWKSIVYLLVTYCVWRCCLGEFILDKSRLRRNFYEKRIIKNPLGPDSVPEPAAHGGANSVYLDGVTVGGEVRLEKENLHVRLQSGTKLDTVVVLAKAKLSGSGTIETLTVSVSGVTVDRNLTISRMETSGGAKAPTVYNLNRDGSSGGGSSSGGSGGTVTPPMQEDKPIEGVAAIPAVTVDYGTEEAAAKSKLPATVTLTCQDGSTVSAEVTAWAISGYLATPTAETTYTATGTIAIPSGYTYSGMLTATTTITVRAGGKTIQKIVVPTGIEVDYGMSETDAMAQLSTEATLQPYSGDTVFGAVTWNLKSGEAYNATPAGEAAVTTYTGTVTLPAGYSYQGETTIETTITILLSGQTAMPKYVKAEPPVSEVYIESFVYYDDIAPNMTEVLPKEIRLYCTDDSPNHGYGDSSKLELSECTGG